MFAEACEIAKQFTRPVVISRRDQNGKCSASIGTFVVVNKEGWALTAWHIVEEAEKLALAAQSFQHTEAAKTSGHD